MNVIVDSNLHISDEFVPPLELHFQKETTTIKDLLLDLAERCQSMELLTEDGLLGQDVEEMSINGEDFFVLKKGVNTCLHKGDRVNLQFRVVQLSGG